MLGFVKVPACRSIEGDQNHKTLLMDANLQTNDTFINFAKEKELKFEVSEIELGYDNFNY